MNLRIIKTIIFFPIKFLFYYLLGCFLIYIFSAILFLNKITPDIRLIKDYQRNFNVISGTRNIWQAQLECIKFNKILVYVPAEKSCKFQNIEFDTKVSFDTNGRKQTHPPSDLSSIVVIGDSVAMGWGVNDNETFSYFLEKKLKRPIYNLGVAGNGTKRQLIYLKNKINLSNIDTIIVQYHYNDLDENMKFKENDLETAKKKFGYFSKKFDRSYLKLFRKSFRYSALIPFDIIFERNKRKNFTFHRKYFFEALNEHPEFKNKKVIFFYTNPYEIKYKNYLLGQDKEFKNTFFYDLDIKEKHFFNVDDHLNVKGHKHVAKKLADIINTK